MHRFAFKFSTKCNVRLLGLSITPFGVRCIQSEEIEVECAPGSRRLQ